MEKFISTESKNSLLKLGLYQIVGGAVGLLRLLWNIITVGSMSGPSAFLSIIGSGLFGYSIYAGFLCIRISKRALSHSLINQGLQIVGFNIVGYAFKYVAGFSITVGLDLTNDFRFIFDVGLPHIVLTLFGNSQNIQIGINIIAFIIFYLVDSLNKKIKTEIEVRSDTRFLN